MKKLLSLGMVFALSLASLIPTGVSASETGSTIIQTNISPTGNIDVSYTTNITIVINENGEYSCSPISVVNNSTFPIEIGFAGYSNTSSLNDILKNDAIFGTLTGSETDADLKAIAAKFGVNKSKNIYLALKDSVTSQYVQNFVTDEIPFASLNNQITTNSGYYKKGIISGGNSISFELFAIHGLSFPEAVIGSRSLDYEFRLAE
jgi:hypothetical protein